MNRWESRFDSHAVWNVTDELSGLIDQLPPPAGSEALSSVARLKGTVELLREHKEKGRKEFYSNPMLSNVQSQISSYVNNNLSTFLNNPAGNPGSLDAAADGVDYIMEAVSQWPSLPPGTQAQVAGKAFAAYRDTATEALEGFKSRNQDLEAQLDALREKFIALDNHTTGLAEKYDSNLESRNSEFEDAIARVENSGEQAYDKAIERDLTKRTEELDRIRSSAESDAEKAKKFAEEAAKYKESSEESAGWLAKKSISSDFDTRARNLSRAGIVYEFFGVSIGAGTIIALLLHYTFGMFGSPVGDSVIAVSLARFSVTIGLLVIAGYLLTRGASNHKQARANKSAAIRLVMLESFISRLTSEQQEEIRNGIATNIFLNGRLAEEDDESTWHIAHLLRAREKKSDEGKS
ncbi:Uncharacterised protein [Mycobacteroides abscessus subsp. abscessus]|nr:Uncharacterised protein [Mycobacteroides abscessus subsp. abscessus]SHZ36457.1 Uncharacterised protein [Mycobacteroides abscessus subsp. abscessus]SHZ68275.1 Uncharacterised protein [Mycobacteroides abscessus subsp. abscessus]SHZ81851.1 Uncharacterised protein [Mycobacteroides abscessus subsp. abscessus]SIA02302.1 Uncharacterised protein [Mycobacteroides abscessus subsp. abscessus]